MSDVLTVGSLFAGIGGIDLGLERTGGFQTSWFCEIDPFCQRVLNQHWPGRPCYPDITKLHSPESVDVLAGGFPCQDISLAGKGAGITGTRSVLWRDFARLIGKLRPQYVIVENVPALRRRGLHRVLQDLNACGYDAEWDGLPACAFGAPHRRDRVWIVAYPYGQGSQRLGTQCQLRETEDQASIGRSYWWSSEPDVDRVAYGVPRRVDRLRALGNAAVPQVAQWIGERILMSRLRSGSA